MARHRRNKIVVWEWSPNGTHKEPSRRARKRSVAREAVGAVVLLGTIIFLLSKLPDTHTGGYRRDQLARYMCEVVGTRPDTPQCVAVSIGGWFVVVVTIGILLKVARVALKAARFDRGDS